MSLLEILIVLLVLAWLTGGFIAGPAAWSISNPVHILLVVVLVLVVVRVLQGRRIG